jgi:hypothetical protein
MPADWGTFITNVGNKLSGQSIQGSYDSGGKDVDDFATYLANQYVLAIAGKAQTPFGNLHQKGNTQLLTTAFTQAFKLLENEQTPTLEEKLKDPAYADLEEPVAKVNPDEYLDKFDLDFLAWAELNGESIPDFIYSIFFSQFPDFPATREQQVLEIARRIVKKYDGTSDYIQWIYSLKLSPGYSEWAKDISAKALELIKGLGTAESKKVEEFKNLQNIEITKELFQEEHANDPERIPDYMVKDFIIKFTYDSRYESGIFKQLIGNVSGVNNLINDKLAVGTILKNQNLDRLFTDKFSELGLGNNLDVLKTLPGTPSYLYRTLKFDSIKLSKSIAYDYEAARFRDLKQRYIQELSDKEKKADEAGNQKDPYYIMATGVLAYWASTLQQPFTPTPPVPPCLITLPLGGFYTPIYYGSGKRLADYLKRAFNSGKRFKTIPERQIGARVVASALAFSFAANMLEFKLIYNGGVPTTGAPAPMIGFVPIVF